MQSLLTDTLLPTTVTTGSDTHATARRDVETVQDPDAEQQPTDKPVSIRVILSDDALERAAKARKAVFQMADAAQSRHDLARTRVAQIRQRIDTLKRMLMLLGKAAAKAILRELRQLAGELGQAANALKDSGGVQDAAGAPPAAAATPVVQSASGAAATESAGDTPAISPAGAAEDARATGSSAGPSTPTAAASRALAAYAAASDITMDTDASASDTPATDTAARADAAKSASVPDDTDTASDRNDNVGALAGSRLASQAARKRRDDGALSAAMVRGAIRDMKELLAMLTSKLRQNDRAAQKQLAAVHDTLAEAERAAQAIGGGAMRGIGRVGGIDGTDGIDGIDGINGMEGMEGGAAAAPT